MLSKVEVEGQNSGLPSDFCMCAVLHMRTHMYSHATRTWGHRCIRISNSDPWHSAALQKHDYQVYRLCQSGKWKDFN